MKGLRSRLKRLGKELYFLLITEGQLLHFQQDVFFSRKQKNG